VERRNICSKCGKKGVKERWGGVEKKKKRRRKRRHTLLYLPMWVVVGLFSDTWMFYPNLEILSLT
jgi:hypothetical protein